MVGLRLVVGLTPQRSSQAGRRPRAGGGRTVGAEGGVGRGQCSWRVWGRWAPAQEPKLRAPPTPLLETVASGACGGGSPIRRVFCGVSARRLARMGQLCVGTGWVVWGPDPSSGATAVPPALSRRAAPPVSRVHRCTLGHGGHAWPGPGPGAGLCYRPSPGSHPLPPWFAELAVVPLQTGDRGDHLPGASDGPPRGCGAAASPCACQVA